MMGTLESDVYVRSCTVCGAIPKSAYLLTKESDGRGNGSIALYRCKACRTVYLAEYSEFYDEDLYAYYEKYKGLEKEKLYNPLTRKSYIRVLGLLASHGGGVSILDVGCGKGDFVDAALAEGYSVEGIELAEPAVDIARKYGLPVTKLDFFSSVIKESSKDIVTMFEVVEHLPDPISFLRRAEMVVKPGGLIYMTTPNFNSLDRRVLGSKWKAIHREHLSYFTVPTLLAAVRNHTTLDLVHCQTRNISEELLSHIKNRVRASSKPSHDGQENTSERKKPIDLRTKIEASPLLLLLKRSANSVLNITSLGSTIVMLLRRPE